MEENLALSLKGTGIWSTFVFFLGHSCRELCRRLCYFIISFLSCYLAVSVALVANTIIGNSPLLFLKMSEMNQGEIDITLTVNADTTVYLRYLNATRIDELTRKNPLLSPRLIFPSAKATTNTSTPYNISLLLFDSQREDTLNIGRNFYDSQKGSKALGQGECGVHKSLANYLQLSVGSKFDILVSLNSYLGQLYALYDPEAYKKAFPPDVIPVYPVYRISCKVATIFSSLEGKVPSDDDGSYLYMEYSQFLKHFALSVSEKGERFPPNFQAFLAKIDPYNIASHIVCNHPNRQEVYKNSDFDQVQKVMTGYASNVLSTLGFFPLITDMPILSDLQSLSMAAVFLGIILNLVIIILAVISSYLVYSLLMISFETRIFEIGMFRLTGLSKYGICALVIVQALLFVLPALIIGIGTSFLFLYFISNMFEQSLNFSFTPVPNGTAFAWAICVGFMVPLTASFLPIREILGKTLNNSLDVSHSKTQGVHITIEYAQSSVDWGIVAFGIITIIYGLALYYLLPYSLLSMNFQIMLWLMLSILLALIIGLIILSLNIQHFVESGIVYALLLFETAFMKALLLKNMIAHRMRNRRTGIILTLVIGFLLFIIVGYTMELKNTELTMLSKHGAYLELRANKNERVTYGVMIEIEKELEKYDTLISGYSWITFRLAINPNMKMRENYIVDYGRLYKYLVDLDPIPPNFFEVSNNLFLDVYQKNSSSGLALGEQLYTPRGSQAVGTGAFLDRELGVTATNMKATFLTFFDRLSTAVAYESRAQFLLNACPAFLMSQRLKSYQVATISYPLLMKLTNATSFSLLRFNRLLIKTRGTNMKDYDIIYGSLTALVAKLNAPVSVWSYANQANNIESIKGFLDTLFLIIIALFMLLCVFSLISSMTANVLEQTKELAVLRAIGMTKMRTVVMYFYEATLIVLSSSFIGSIIGALIGFTLILQRVLYSDLPITFNFPWFQFGWIFICSICCAAISSISPALFLVKRNIGELAKY